MSGFHRGISLENDNHYFNKKKKVMNAMSFPSIYKEKVDMTKINRDVINLWIQDKITDILGFEDEIVSGMTINLLNVNSMEKLDPKDLQLQMTGFLQAEAPAFMEELWSLLLGAQCHPTGIPQILLDAKKTELQEKKQIVHGAEEEVKVRIEELRQAARESIPALAKEAARTKTTEYTSKYENKGRENGSAQRDLKRENVPKRQSPPRQQSRDSRPKSPPPRRQSPPRRQQSPRRQDVLPVRQRSSRRTPPRRQSPRRSESRGRYNRRDSPPRRRSYRSPSRSASRGRRRGRDRSPSPRKKESNRQRSPESPRGGRRSHSRSSSQSSGSSDSSRGSRRSRSGSLSSFTSSGSSDNGTSRTGTSHTADDASRSSPRKSSP